MNEKLLRLLEKNSRIDLHEAAIMLNMSDAEVASLVASFEKDKVICGYYTMINWDNTTDERCSAFIEVKVTPQRGVGYDKIADRIKQFEEVESVYLMAGAYDFAVLIEGKTMKEVSKFVFEKLATLDTVTSTATHFVLKKYKDHGIDMSSDVNEDKRIIGIGYNGFPKGCSDDVFPWGKTDTDTLNTKYPYVVHAEANCILNCTSQIKGSTLYVSLFPCNECAKLIIQSGIKHIVYMSDKHGGTPSNLASKRMLDAAGITYEKMESFEVEIK